MPSYDYRCVECDHLFSGISTIAKRRKAVCPKCGGKTYISLERSNPSIQPDMKPYFDRGLDKMVYGRQDRKQKMEAMGLEEGGGGSIDRQALENLEEAKESKYANR